MTIALILYFLLAIIVMRRIILYGIRPTKTLAWILAISTIPIGGMLFYFVLGRNKRKTKFYKLKKTPEISEYLKKVEDYNHTFIENQRNTAHPLIKENMKIVKLLTKSAKFSPSFGNELTPLKDGQETFDAIFKAIDTASQYIHIQYYLFEDGELANRFLSVLASKVAEGVEVRFIYDDFGSSLLSSKYLKLMENSGIKVCSFLPMRFGNLISSLNYRNHRKIVVVDGLVAFTGGINVSDKYIIGDPKLGPWHDRHLQLEGPIVGSLQAVFALDWSLASGNDELLSSQYFFENPKVGKSIAQVISSGPDSDFSSILQLYFSIINSAKEYVYITNPYIVPGEVLVEAIKVAALSGIDVRFLLSAVSDSVIVKWTIRSYFEDFLKAGVKIYQYPDGFLHSKVIVSDDKLTTIGTANMDIRSFEQNYEVNILVYENEFAKKYKDDFLVDCNKSKQISYNDFINRPQSDRMKEGLAKIFSPVI